MGGVVHNTCLCFDPDGKVVHQVIKCHLTAFEPYLDGGSEQQLRTFATPMGQVGALICLDSFFSSCYRQLRDASPTGHVDVLLVPSLMSPPSCWYARWDGKSPLPSELPAALRADIGVLPEWQLWDKHARRCRRCGEGVGSGAVLRSSRDLFMPQRLTG